LQLAGRYFAAAFDVHFQLLIAVFVPGPNDAADAAVLLSASTYGVSTTVLPSGSPLLMPRAVTVITPAVLVEILTTNLETARALSQTNQSAAKALKDSPD